MPVILKNVGTQQEQGNTVDPYESTVRTTVEGIEYVVGPNMLVSFADPTIAFKVAAFVSVASVGFRRVIAATSQDKPSANSDT